MSSKFPAGGTLDFFSPIAVFGGFSRHFDTAPTSHKISQERTANMASKNELNELNDIWKSVMQSFTSTLPDLTIELWFAPLRLESFDGTTVVFSTDSELKHRIINEKYIELLENGFTSFFGFPVSVKLELVGVDEPAEEKKEQPYVEQPLEQIVPTFHEAVEVGSESFPHHFEYTFDNFIEGNSNKFARAACFSVANNPTFLERNPEYAKNMRNPHNPLFVYGPSGLGKTHLLHAIINRIKENFPTAKILYIKGDDFTNQLIDHLARGAMNEFKEKYRKCDVLLIDDIQFIAGKASTQEEFFHTFNSLYEENKQIILTSDRPPREIKPLEERLVTRFEWGLLADIQPPDFELRIAIIKKKSEEVGIVLSEEVLDFIADNLRSNIRQIEGAIKKLAAQSFLSGNEINIELAQSCILELMGGEEPIKMKVDKIFTAIKRHYNVSREEILSENRKKEIANARHITVYLIRILTEISFPDIKKILNKKNHTTCMSSFQLMEKRMAENPAFQTEVNAIIKELTGK